MPFKIIRNDITKVRADAIVNSANPRPIFDSGTDYAIYHAAGVKELLEARRKIGNIAIGNARVTNAFHLKSLYIIHTVGPVWEGGDQGEYEALKNCYINSLDLAVKLKCKSIAFPLISTGIYGFPKDRALEIAMSCFSRFLDRHKDINIILVVFDKTAYKLSEKIADEVDAFIKSNYVNKSKTQRKAKESYISNETEENISSADDSIGASFHDILIKYVISSGMDNSEIWHRANMDRKIFSKIICEQGYHPKKKTVMSLCIALNLNLEQSKDLMSRADWAFSPCSKFDLIVQKAIIDKQYDIMKLNMVLFKYTDKILRS